MGGVKVSGYITPELVIAFEDASAGFISYSSESSASMRKSTGKKARSMSADVGSNKIPNGSFVIFKLACIIN